MLKRKRLPRPIFPVLAACLLVVVLAVTFGQVLGRFYLKNLDIGDETQHGAAYTSARESNGKKKVLRLNKFEYYSIEVASRQDKESALSIGKILAQKGYGPVITGQSPFRVLLELANNPEVLQPQAETISVDGQKAVVVKGIVNEYSYKFSSDDSFAAERIAPFLGAISTCLEKSLEKNSEMPDQVQELSTLLEKTYLQGAGIIQSDREEARAADISLLVGNLKEWSGNAADPQYALALLEVYQRFLYTHAD